ncbi:sensor histidine kinase [Caballeronia sp. GAFFF2]|uniref:sensor histidine kinase n=1 Tax=Caballeronia sp. GAFFF2 TaxID=2921741 RepID=UPI002027DB07|nr:sensor histidine kinase [Caballeronia sp. GAFFF2]
MVFSLRVQTHRISARAADELIEHITLMIIQIELLSATTQMPGLDTAHWADLLRRLIASEQCNQDQRVRARGLLHKIRSSAIKKNGTKCCAIKLYENVNQRRGNAMMNNFLSNNRSELIERCRLRVVARSSFTHASERLETGIPLFLDQLIVTLRVEQGSDPLTSRAIFGPSLGSSDASEMGASAGQYANKLQLLNVSIEEVVHQYGDLCQVIMALAREPDVPFLVDEYQTLNRCLDNAIAKAVMEFAYQRGNADRSAQGKQDREDTAALVHELRNALSSATIAFEAAKKGNLNLNGATGTVLQRGLDSLRSLINRSLDELKGETDKGLSSEKFQLAGFIQDVAPAATLAAHVRDVAFTALPIEQGLAVWADRDELYSAVTSLVQNGFKFTKPIPRWSSSPTRQETAF